MTDKRFYLHKIQTAWKASDKVLLMKNPKKIMLR